MTFLGHIVSSESIETDQEDKSCQRVAHPREVKGKSELSWSDHGQPLQTVDHFVTEPLFRLVAREFNFIGAGSKDYIL